MKILLNFSNLKIGGGLQVAHSFLYGLKDEKKHEFCVVLSEVLYDQIILNSFDSKRFQFHKYQKKITLKSVLLGKDDFLNVLEQGFKPTVVFSLFGPTYWRPKSKHIVGFAKPQYIYRDSPFFYGMSIKSKFFLKFKEVLHLRDFQKNADILISENKDVSLRLGKIFSKKEIFTVSNYYNQVFDHPENWDETINLPPFKGISLLTLSANYPHKNLKIIPQVLKALQEIDADLKFRFIVTLKDLPDYLISEAIVNVGQVRIEQCPHLYNQVNAVFIPTLLECFTATYPEAMRMGKPILTSDLPFARGICGSSAIFFDPLNPEDIARKIVDLSSNENLHSHLVKDGFDQLKNFDNYLDRTKKYLEIITS
ncbi:glycosyltransferase [Cecembia lonarensis]|uniref:Glycosyl transferases group 1 n=1 Tax=Cecembia lonarensis (strain CCUG 58316 / KCTC 22772 / LW9) TaxID=1225176 RepID=K1KWS8_CECL9|nr:glycosyltransferase [Cecembia lonarensis]EKB48605.1 Glycosyl transferases group 1 [Cecembia lonarensis LW9]